MSDLDVMRELVAQVRPPAYEELVAVARRRRRRLALTLTGATAAVGAVLAVTALSGGQRAVEPASDPPPSQTGEWTPERIRAEGMPWDEFRMLGNSAPFDALTESGSSPGAQLYGTVDKRVVLEVTDEGQTALFEVRYWVWVAPFDEDSVLVMDGDVQMDPSVRYQLLKADGTAVPMQMIDEKVPAIPGPDVMMIDDWGSWSAGGGGAEELHLVDEAAGTISPLDVPDEEAIRYWGPNVDEFLWGVSDDCRVFWATAGTFEERQLDCRYDTAGTYLFDKLVPASWLQPGRMVVMERTHPAPTGTNILHVSRDSGVTWQEIPVEEDSFIPGALLELD